MVNLREILAPIATWFRSLEISEPIVHWSHPLNDGNCSFCDGQLCRTGRLAGKNGWG